MLPVRACVIIYFFFYAQESVFLDVLGESWSFSIQAGPSNEQVYGEAGGWALWDAGEHVWARLDAVWRVLRTYANWNILWFLVCPYPGDLYFVYRCATENDGLRTPSISRPAAVAVVGQVMPGIVYQTYPASKIQRYEGSWSQNVVCYSLLRRLVDIVTVTWSRFGIVDVSKHGPDEVFAQAGVRLRSPFTNRSAAWRRKRKPWKLLQLCGIYERRMWIESRWMEWIASSTPFGCGMQRRVAVACAKVSEQQKRDELLKSKLSCAEGNT